MCLPQRAKNIKYVDTHSFVPAGLEGDLQDFQCVKCGVYLLEHNNFTKPPLKYTVPDETHYYAEVSFDHQKNYSFDILGYIECESFILKKALE